MMKLGAEKNTKHIKNKGRLGQTELFMVWLPEAIDIVVIDGLSFIVNLEEEDYDASVLYEMPSQEGNERRQGHNNEKR